MKVIFLDIEGVLNTVDTIKNNTIMYRKTGIHYENIDEERVKYLKEIVEKTGASIVLSSSGWKIDFTKKDGMIIPIDDSGKYLLQMFRKYNITLLDITGNHLAKHELEIKDWLEEHREVDNYLILDDECFHLPETMRKHYIQTTLNYEKDNGLLESHIEKAIDILNKPLKEKIFQIKRNN